MNTDYQLFALAGRVAVNLRKLVGGNVLITAEVASDDKTPLAHGPEGRPTRGGSLTGLVESCAGVGKTAKTNGLEQSSVP